jgi:predicted ArsR family transcriptional regulator
LQILLIAVEVRGDFESDAIRIKKIEGMNRRGNRAVFGEAGLDRLIEAIQEAAVAADRRALVPCSGLEDRVPTVARLRTEEGYMAEFEAEPDGSFLLIENHCPICAAAKTCQGFCRSELELFRAAFGTEALVMRQEHLLSNGRRCVYRVTSREGTDS